MQRAFDVAIALVHHSSKKQRAQPGQALRGSSDLHAFGDCNAYLSRRNDRIILNLEHRAAQAPKPVEMELISDSDGSKTHLQIVSISKTDDSSLSNHVLSILNSEKPLTQTIIRQQLKINNQRLTQTMAELHEKGLILRTSKGWIPVTSPAYITQNDNHPIQPYIG